MLQCSAGLVQTAALLGFTHMFTGVNGGHVVARAAGCREHPYILQCSIPAERRGTMTGFEAFHLRTIEPGAQDDWRPAWKDHLLRLDPDSRRSRFLAPANDLMIGAYVAAARPAALVLGEVGGVLRGCAEIHAAGPPGMAEISVSVEPEWQSRGLGRRLTAEARAQAARMGFSDIRLTCLRQNIPMMRIARALSACRLPVADWALALFRFDPAPGAP